MGTASAVEAAARLSGQDETAAESQGRTRSRITRGRRFAFYGLLGWSVEVVFSAVGGYVRQRDRRLLGQTSLWMFPIYGLVQPLYEPVHRALEARLRAPARALLYGVGFLVVEYLTGRLLRELSGQAPWDYSHARLNHDGLIRLDYLPLWAGAGLGLERVHDRLTAGS